MSKGCLADSDSVAKGCVHMALWITCAIFIVVYMCFSNAFILHQYWTWFMPYIWAEAPMLNIKMAFFLQLVFGFLSPNYARAILDSIKKKELTTKQQTAGTILILAYPWISWVLGWIVKCIFC